MAHLRTVGDHVYLGEDIGGYSGGKMELFVLDIFSYTSLAIVGRGYQAMYQKLTSK